LYRVHLSEEQQAELRRRASSRETVPRTRDRLEMVRLAGAGWSIPRIARLLHKSEEQVRYWVKRFLEGGFDALPDAPHLGQQSALTPAILASVREHLRHSERTWSAQHVADWIAEEPGVRRSADRVRRAMRGARLSSKRTHRHLKQKQDPEAVAKKSEELAQLEKGGLGSA